MKRFFCFLLTAAIVFSGLELVYASAYGYNSSGGDEIIEEFSLTFNEDVVGTDYYLAITEITDTSVRFDVEYISYNALHIYSAEDIVGELSGNTVKFTWTDSWSNSGTGTFVINDGSVDLNIVVTKEALVNFNTLGTGDRPNANSDGSITLTSTKNPGAAYQLINELSSQKTAIYLNGEELSFSQAPYIEDGTTMVPMRSIFEALGAQVDWNSDTRTVTAVKDNKTVIFTIDSTTAYINGTASSLLKAPVILNGTTMVPLRFVAEALDCNCNYEAETKIINITK